MGKPKKGSKSHDHEEDDDDHTPQEAMEEKSQPLPSNKKEKKKKGKKAGDDDWDDIEKELKVMSLDENGTVDDDDDDDDQEVAAPAKKKKVKTKGKSAFEMLAEMDDMDGGSDEDTKEEETTSEVQVSSEPAKSKKKDKKKKDREKHKKEEDEDIDAILADLEKPVEKEGKKKKRHKHKEDTPESESGKAETAAVDVAETPEHVMTLEDIEAEYEDEKKRKKGKGKVEEKVAETPEGDVLKTEEAGEENGQEDSTMKSAAQKKKEKKEREKQKKLQDKQKQLKKEAQKSTEESQVAGSAEIDGETPTAETPSTEAAPEGEAKVEAEEHSKEKDAKKKKKKKGEKEKKEEEKPKVNKKLAALKEHLQKIKEEEERAREEEERKQKEEEERIRILEEEKRLEEERRKKKREKKKGRKVLTVKQKQEKLRLDQMLESMRAQGLELPGKDEAPRKKPVYGKKRKPSGSQGDQEKSPSPVVETPVEEEKSIVEEDSETVAPEVKKEEKDDVKDAWDASSEEEESETEETSSEPVAQTEEKKSEEQEEEDDDEEDESDEEEESEEDESSEESESESEDHLTPVEKGREKALKRATEAEKHKSATNLRAPVVCVLGHVDTGKTKILDKLRRTNVQDGEAGGITQQIGATNVPQSAILEKTKMCKEFCKQELLIPGLLIIDTPGHESFKNLRVRGSSLCDIAILVVDIMHGLEAQTLESIKLLRSRKTPFVVALNKIDRLYQWKAQPMTDVVNTIKKQSQHTKYEFDERAQQVILQLAEEGFNAALMYENKNPKEYISLVPTSAHSGDGMGNLLALVCELSQNMLTKRLMYSQNLQASVMEVKAITGIGTTIDVILINGVVHEGETIVIAGTEGPIVTQIRGLLMPQPMKELRVKNQYEHHKKVVAAQGVKIIAKDMEKALAGLPLHVAYDNDEMEYYKGEVALALKDVLESIKVQDRGVFVQASTLGSLEALLEFLRTSQIPYAGINIGPVHRKDIMRASVMLEHNSEFAVILAFDVRVEREAQELADNLGVRVFTAEIIYHLFDAFTKYRADLKKKKQEEFKHIAVFPCKLQIMPQYVFNSRDPIVCGVKVEAGFVKEGTPICVPSKEFLDLGRVASIEANHKTVDMAKQGQEVCIRIMPIPGEAPKMFGRHFDEKDMMVSKISRQSIDAVKDYFREEMSPKDWKLIVELKKQFEIL